MNEGEFRNLMQSYIDPDGLVTILPNQDINSTGNGLLHLGLYIAELHHYGWLKSLDLVNFLAVIHSCQVVVNDRALPLVWRSPTKRNKDDYNSHDDYYGIAMLGLENYGKWFLSYLVSNAEKWHWCLNNQNPGIFKLRFYHGWRLPWVSHLRSATEDGPSPMDNLITALSILLHFPGAKHDSNIHTWLMCEMSRNKSDINKWAVNIWEKRARKKFGTIGKSFAGYFRNENHPLCALT